MIKHRADSIKELNEKQAAEAKKDKPSPSRLTPSSC